MKLLNINWKFVLIILSSLLYAILSVAFSIILMKMTDSLIAGNLTDFIKFVSIQAFTVFLQIGMFYINGKLVNKYIQDQIYNIRLRIMKSILNFSYSMYKSQGDEEYISLLLTNIQTLETDYYEATLNMISKTLLLIITVITIFILNPLILGGIVVCILIILFIPLIFNKLILKSREVYMNNTDKYTQSVNECFAGYEVIKCYRMIHKILERYKKFLISYLESNRKFKDIVLLSNSILASSTMIFSLIIFICGGYLVSNGKITVGGLMAAVQLVMYVIEPCVNIAENNNLIKSTQPIREKIKKFIKQGESSTENLEIIHEFNNIVLNNVTYSYGKDSNNALENINYTFEMGKKYAIVGKNGSGKSTLLKIIARIITEYEGKIRIDSKDYKHVAFGKIGVVEQENFLFGVSIEENINSLDKEKNFELLQEIIKKLDMYKFIDSHEDKLNFIVDRNLSGGEKQKVCIARALRAQPNILLLDEPNSALDIKNKERIDKLVAQMQGVLCIMITHKIDESLKQFDKIILMQEGKIIAEGSYDEIIMNYDFKAS